jgi:hypothetical protein
MHAEMKVVAELVVPAAPGTVALEEDDDIEEDNFAEPSILHILNKN